MASSSNGSNGGGNAGAGGQGFRPDVLQRRVMDIPGLPRRQSPAEVETPNKLTVSREVSLSGEIAECDHLVVHGRLDGRVAGAESLEISATGQFKGNASVDAASVSGRFEGDLQVRGRLTVHDGGNVSGTIAYGELMVEPGGRVSGQLSHLEGATVMPMPERGDAPVPRR
ncbi:MAG: polymer-forming cytoskeletal protein [Azospirillaceae bacterium]